MLVYEDIDDVIAYYLLKGTYLGVLQVLNESSDYNSSIKLNVTHTDGSPTVFELTVTVADLIKVVSDNPGSLVYYSDHEYKVTQGLEEILYRINDRSGSGGGTPGDSAYVYIAYASNSSGAGFTMTFNPSLDYIAILATDTEILSPAAGDFAGLWYKRKGDIGDTGPPGPGVPAGGATGQILRKNDETDYNSQWVYCEDDLNFDYRDIENKAMTYVLVLKAAFAFEIVSLWAVCDAATSINEVTIKINGVAVTGISAATVTTTPQEFNASDNFTVAVGDTITLTATGITGTPTELVGTLKRRRV